MKILHLYPDFMNLYGEKTNLFILKLYLEAMGIYVVLEKKCFDDKINFNEYDFIYMGSGLESNQKCVLKNLKKYNKEIKEVIEKGVVFLLTGNAFEIFGKSINEEDSYVECLNIFDFETTKQFNKRISSDVIFETKLVKNPILGFINKCSEVKGIKDHFFSVLKGIGDNKKGEYEGLHKFNFFGTHVLGPILIRNPEFLEKIAEIIMKRSKISLSKKNEKIESVFKKIQTYTKNSYEITLQELQK